eukprot:m.60564 g.60564  ORF g.60564 m.60564 type:complete len:66 (+) comp7951_c0_seq1:45-242(+)
MPINNLILFAHLYRYEASPHHMFRQLNFILKEIEMKENIYYTFSPQYNIIYYEYSQEKSKLADPM